MYTWCGTIQRGTVENTLHSTVPINSRYKWVSSFFVSCNITSLNTSTNTTCTPTGFWPLPEDLISSGCQSTQLYTTLEFHSHVGLLKHPRSLFAPLTATPRVSTSLTLVPPKWLRHYDCVLRANPPTKIQSKTLRRLLHLTATEAEGPYEGISCRRSLHTQVH